MQCLQNVNPEFLCQYSEILGCKDLDKHPLFNQAIERLGDKIGNIISDDTNLDAAAKSGFSLCKILKDLTQVKHNAKKAIEIFPIAYNISIELAKKGRFEAIRRLEKTVDYLGKPKLKKDSNVPTATSKCHFKAYQEISQALSIEFEQAREDGQHELCDIISGLISKLNEWHRNPRMKAPEGLLFTGKTIANGQIEEIYGTIYDIDYETGQCFLAALDNIVECEIIENPKELFQLGKKQLPKRVLHIKNANGKEYYIDSLTAKFNIPSKDKDKYLNLDEDTIYPVLGCNAKKEGGSCTAVFSCEKPVVKNHQNLIRLRPIEGRATKGAIAKYPKVIEINSHPPFATGSKGLFTALINWFKNLAVKISRDRGYMAYWTGKPQTPVGESTINGTIRGLLSEYVDRRGGHLSPEEEASKGKLDYFVSRGNDKVVIELKRSINQSQCKNGISKQLPNYMDDKKAEYGIFVIFCFNHMFQKDSKEIKELCKLRDDICNKNKIEIKIVTINCDRLSSSDSKTKKFEDADERYCEY